MPNAHDLPEQYIAYKKTLTPAEQAIYEACVARLEANQLFMAYAAAWNKNENDAYGQHVCHRQL